MKDYFGNILEVGDEIVYIGVNGHVPKIQEGKILAFDMTRKYDSVQVLGDTNKRPGWTYLNRIINKKFVSINETT